MRRPIEFLPSALTLLIVGAMLWHGPIVQPANYHAFADNSVFLGCPHSADVFSNLGFALVGLFGWFALRPQRAHIGAAWYGYRLFLLGLTLTALGSAYYHLAPDNARLVWDRLPIALACAGVLAAVRAECGQSRQPQAEAAILALLAAISVAWWHFTDRHGQGDLRPYLLVQLLPLLLIPLWQHLYPTPSTDRLCFAFAIVLYVAAKAAELHDHEISNALQWTSGHTLKHLLATVAAAVLTLRLWHRTRRTVLT